MSNVIKIAIQIVESYNLAFLHVLASKIVLKIAGEGDRRRIVVLDRKTVGTPFVPILGDE
ncbi:hypothetical protein A2U01_0068760, partial [Trifolium medium]|nr:hypothetical protein [Trifolium medium]